MLHLSRTRNNVVLAGRSVQQAHLKDSTSRAQENLFRSANRIWSTAPENLETMAAMVDSWIMLSKNAKKMFGDEVNITLERRRHLGAVIGSKSFKGQYCQEKVDKWLRELESLTEISRSQPHAAYVAFTKGFKFKFTYCLRTIESFEDYVDPIEEAIHTSFLPSLFGRVEPLPGELKDLVELSPAQGGIGIPSLKREAPEQFKASTDITALHVNSIVAQSSTIPAQEELEERKREINSQRRAETKLRIDGIDESLSPDLLQAVQQTRDKGASSWLNATPIEEHGLALNKQEFRDSLCLRYNLALPNLPSHCACGECFTVNHALSCKKGGFVSQRHDTIRDLLTSHISKVCKNVETEPLLQPLDNEVFNLQSTVTSQEARLDMKAGGFWTPGVTAFFDVRVTHVNSRSNQGKTTETIFRDQENEKKRKYNQRVINVEMGTFTPLVFGTNGGMGVDCQNFLRNLAHKISNKNNESYATVITWLRTQLSFSILRSTHRCVRGSRKPFKLTKLSEDIELASHSAGLFY